MVDAYGSRRTFFVHAAHRTVGVAAAPAAARLGDRIEMAPAFEAERPIRVCLVSGCPHYESDVSLAALAELLQRHYRATCDRAFSRRSDDLPGLEHLDRTDCLLLFARRMAVDGEPLEQIRRYCRRGGAVVGVQAADHAFQNWPEMEREVLGCDSRGHFGNRLTEVEIAEAAEGHPVLCGVGPFASRGALYENAQIADDATVLLRGTFPGQTHPVAWVRRHCGGRVFCTSLGHPLDFLEPNFLRLLANAVSWTCNL